MEILIGNYKLYAGPDGGQFLSGLSGSFDRLMQEAQKPRASGVELFDRQNDRTELSFSISRSHANAVAAEEFALLHALDVPREGIITLVAKAGATPPRRAYLTGKVTSIALTEHKGSRTEFRYTIVGGRMSRIQPEA